jgi:quercetin dioxygenase-like cupin family protein
MHHRRLRIPTTAVVITVALFAGSGSELAAQETTPPAETTTPPAEPISVIELAPGFTAEVFAGAPSDRAPDQTVYLARFVIEPGSEIFPHSHPGTTVLGVESGSLGWTLLEGTAHVVRGAAAGNTGPVEDVTEPGTEVVLEVGDAIYYEDDVIHTARGAGDEPTVVWGTLVLTTGEPLLMPAEMDMAGTEPAGTEPAGTAAATTTG